MRNCQTSREGEECFFGTYIHTELSIPAIVIVAHTPHRSPRWCQREDLGRRGRQWIWRAHVRQWLPPGRLRTLQHSRRRTVVELSLVLQARGKSLTNQTGTTGAASGTHSRNLRTSKRSQSPSTGVPREPGAWTCSATERRSTQSSPAARRAISSGSTSTRTKPRSWGSASVTLSGTRTSGWASPRCVGVAFWTSWVYDCRTNTPFLGHCACTMHLRR